MINSIISILILSLINNYTTSTEIKGKDWMKNMKENLKAQPFDNLFLMGSHDSGAYYFLPLNKQEYPEFLIDMSSTFQYLKGLIYFFRGIMYPIIYRICQNQTPTIYEQLNFGVRYLDLRVVKVESSGKLHIIHGLVGVVLQSVFEQILKFLKENPSEVVIIDLQNFYPNFESMREPLNLLIAEYFDSIYYIFMSYRFPSYNEIINSRRRLLILSSTINDYYIFYKVESPFFQSSDKVHVVEFFEKQRNLLGFINVKQLVLTMSVDSFFHIWSLSIQTLSKEINEYYTVRFKNQMDKGKILMQKGILMFDNIGKSINKLNEYIIKYNCK